MKKKIHFNIIIGDIIFILEIGNKRGDGIVYYSMVLPLVED